MFIVALFTIAKIWKQPNCSPIDGWIKKTWFIYTMGYYVAVRKNEILPSTTMWIYMEGVMLSEINQTGKDKYFILYMWNLKNRTT